MGSDYDYRHENKKAKKVYDCSECGWGIYIGDAYFDINGDFICEDCMENMKMECEE